METMNERRRETSVDRQWEPAAGGRGERGQSGVTLNLCGLFPWMERQDNSPEVVGEAKEVPAGDETTHLEYLGR